jgi:WD40 repeat protein
MQLVRPGEGTEDTRRLATFDELVKQDWDLVQYLADCRLVVTGRDSGTGEKTVEVVHEALIQRWGRLREWLLSDRIFRTWQERLRASRRGWEDSKCDEGALLRGALLAEAERWLIERGEDLAQVDREYIERSIELRTARQNRRNRRRRNIVVGLATGLVLAIGLAIIALNARSSAEREAAVNHSLVLSANAQAAQENGEVDLALALALEAVNMDDPPPEARRTLSEIALGPGTRAILAGNSNTVRDVAIDPESKTALSASCAQLSSDGACIQGELIQWDLETETELRRFEGHTDWVNAVAYNPDGTRILSSSEDNTLILWEARTGQVVDRFEAHMGGVNSVAFGPEGQTALSGSDDASLILWDVATGEVIRRFEGHGGRVNCVAFSSDGQTALSGSADTNLILWDVSTGEDIRRFEGHLSEVSDVIFNSDGRTMLSGGDNTLRLWNLETGAEIRQQNFGSAVELLVANPDGGTVLVGGIGPGLRVWDIERWQEVQNLSGARRAELVSQVSAAIGHDGLLALSGSTDGSLRLWNLIGQAGLREFETDGTPLSAVAISPEGGLLLTGDMADQIVLWDVERGEVIRRYAVGAGAVSPNALAFSPDGRYALIGSGDAFGDSGAKSLILWDVDSGERIRAFDGHRSIIRSVAFGPDGRFALSGSQGDNLDDLILWDVETGEKIRRFDSEEDSTSIEFNSDGSLALTGSAFDSSLTLWDVATGQQIRRFEGPVDLVFDVAFGPDERTVLSASGDGSLTLWDVDTGEVLQRYLGHDSWVWSLEVSPDGRYLLSGAEDGVIILWDFETGEELRRFKGHTATVAGLVFSPDGETAFSVALDGALIEWRISDLPLNELIDWTHANRYLRELTCEERKKYRIEPLCSSGS